MKLSEVKGDRVLDVIADIIEPIANIAEDENAAAMFKREKLPEGVTAKAFLLGKIKKAAPSLVKDHKADIVAILAAIEGVKPEAYEKDLNIPKLIRDFLELLGDEAFMSFFQ